MQSQNRANVVVSAAHLACEICALSFLMKGYQKMVHPARIFTSHNDNIVAGLDRPKYTYIQPSTRFNRIEFIKNIRTTVCVTYKDYKMSLFLFIIPYLIIPAALGQDASIMEKYCRKLRISKVELLAGPSLVSIKGVNQDYDVMIKKVGYSAGLRLFRRFSKHFELSTQLLWERKGYKQNQEYLSTSPAGVEMLTLVSYYNVSNDYLTVSFIPQMLLGKLQQFNIGAGIYAGSLERSRTFTQFYLTHQTVQGNSIGAYDKYDEGVALNLGYAFSFEKNLMFTLQFTNNYGLQQISIFHSHNSGFPSFYNRTFLFSLGIRYNYKQPARELQSK